MRLHNVTPDELRGLHAALLDAFPSRAALAAMVQYKLGRNLETISTAESLTQIVHVLLQVSLREGWLGDLVDAALAARPNVPGLKPFARLALPSETPPNPYPGLEPFHETNRAFFFGRDALVDKLLAAVRAKPFIAVVGKQGSGKSSLVRAGLLPRLRQDEKHHWLIAGFRPNPSPLDNLRWRLAELFRDALRQSLPPDTPELRKGEQSRQMEDRFLRPEGTLRNALDGAVAALALPADWRLLIAVDQLEEAFAGPDVREDVSAEAAAPFFDALFSLVDHPRVTILVTLGLDYIGQAYGVPALGEWIGREQFPVLPLTNGELRQAIEGPAHAVKRTFEPGLVEQILADVRHRPGKLFLLQVALARLWEKDARIGVLTTQSYVEIGRVEGALQAHADAVFQQYTPSRQTLVRNLLLKMVSISRLEGETAILPRRVPLDSLGAIERQIADDLVGHRLLTLTTGHGDGGAWIELSHEVLIEAWPTFKAWVDEYAPFLQWLRQIRGLMNTWREAGFHEYDLLQGSLLEEARTYVTRFAALMLPAEHDYARLSIENFDEQLRTVVAPARRDFDSAGQIAQLLRDFEPAHLIMSWRYGIAYEYIDVDCTIRADGSLHVVRRAQMRSYGPLSTIDIFLYIQDPGDPDTYAPPTLRCLSGNRALSLRLAADRHSVRSAQLAIEPPLNKDEELTYELSQTTGPGIYMIRRSADEHGAPETEKFGWTISRPTRRLKLTVRFPPSVVPLVYDRLVWYAGTAGIPSEIPNRPEKSRLSSAVVLQSDDTFAVSLEVPYPMIGLIYLLEWEPAFILPPSGGPSGRCETGLRGA